MADENTPGEKYGLPPADRQVRSVNHPEKPTLYANNVSLRSSIWDFSLDFGMITEANDDELIVHNLATVILSPAHAKTVSQLLTRHVAMYEAQFGVLPQPPSRPDGEDLTHTTEPLPS